MTKHIDESTLDVDGDEWSVMVFCPHCDDAFCIEFTASGVTKVVE